MRKRRLKLRGNVLRRQPSECLSLCFLMRFHKDTLLSPIPCPCKILQRHNLTIGMFKLKAEIKQAKREWEKK